MSIRDRVNRAANGAWDAAPSGHISSRNEPPPSALTALSASRLQKANRTHAAAASGCMTCPLNTSDAADE